MFGGGSFFRSDANFYISSHSTARDVRRVLEGYTYEDLLNFQEVSPS